MFVSRLVECTSAVLSTIKKKGINIRCNELSRIFKQITLDFTSLLLKCQDAYYRDDGEKKP
jgi:hypothetical protein